MTYAWSNWLTYTNRQVVNVIDGKMKVRHVDQSPNLVWKTFQFILRHIEFRQVWQTTDFLQNRKIYNFIGLGLLLKWNGIIEVKWTT